MKCRCLHVLAASLMLILAPGASRAQLRPSVATDRADYSPGSHVSISGSGFQPGERVRLLILQSDLRENGRPEHRPWLVRADKTGTLRATWPVSAHEAGATLWLAAKGLASGRTAQAIFTDASVVPASGGSAIPTSTYTGTFTALTGPVVTETIVGDINIGTIVLTAPAGFVFDTNAPLPLITLSGDNNRKNINGLADGDTIALDITTNTLSFTITVKSHGQTKNTLTYSNIRVRPTAASPLASGNITNTGTSVFPNSTANYGTLTEVAGSTTRLVVSGFPSPQVAGTAGSVTVAAQDQFGNVTTGYLGTIHFTSSDAQALLPADYAFVSADNGTHTFSAGATLRTIGTQSITASNMAPASLSGSQSGILVNPTAANHLAFAAQPGATTYGSLLGPQPVLVSQDTFGNNSTVGIGVSKIVTVTLTSGSGSLLGTVSRDIGTGAGNGTATFNNLEVNAAGAGKQLTASAPGLTGAVSSTFTVAQATVTANVSVNNKVYNATTAATIATNSLSGVLGTDSVTLTGGTAAFDTKSVGNGKSVTVSGLGLGGTAAANYALASTTVTTSANISPATLTVSAASSSKVYDGTPAATVTLSDNRVAGDSLNTSYTSAAFTDKNVGNGKTVNVTGITATGPDAANYTVNTSATALAAITPATLTGTVAGQARLYGQPNPAFSVNYSGFVGGDDAGILTGTLTFSINVGTNSPVGAYAITASGQSAINYVVQYVAGTLTVSPAHLYATANDATRLYGHPNPVFIATISGFVNGEDINVLGGTLNLTTTAQTNSPPGDYPIIPGGLLSANYYITYSNGTLAVTSTNQAPLLAAIPDATVRPDELLVFQISGSDPDGDHVTFSLDAGAPAGSSITNLVTRILNPGGNPTFATNTVFLWTPTRAQASTTNLITVRLTDDGGPPMSSAQTFTVVVLDYVEIALASTNVESGQSVAVPINLASSDGVTNLNFTVALPNGYLANAALVATAPEIGTASLQDYGTNLVVSIQAIPGQVLQGSQQVALLTFEAISNLFSAFVPLPVSNAVAAKPDGTSYVNYLAPLARIAVIEGQPLLVASLSTNWNRELALYGRLGHSYQLQSSTSLASPTVWAPQWDYVQTNGVITIGVSSANPRIFYRIFEP
jgi:hypothetical protein